ncbi:hypothetical protein SARC_04636 [Sphaeroforma arctica JP610]|uniref:Uncharacterized protein n=1 Tax=Sphaeroforma arctica JP610 TaxID=667725 RepID=A0A0L0G4G2_9EUKA|nr:hypothetical protein SARC_04636 [Sphaeroforma arctica JP610]KNC83098.1 hypothetical protein SARC_04636 [Sphaeroforma arctica JP610]|eukprot:XP_014157000.1 hypothetical protein SARC_04636 [Sphaeroforma arctica JP610]
MTSRPELVTTFTDSNAYDVCRLSGTGTIRHKTYIAFCHHHRAPTQGGHVNRVHQNEQGRTEAQPAHCPATTFTTRQSQNNSTARQFSTHQSLSQPQVNTVTQEVDFEPIPAATNVTRGPVQNDTQGAWTCLRTIEGGGYLSQMSA